MQALGSHLDCPSPSCTWLSRGASSRSPALVSLVPAQASQSTISHARLTWICLSPPERLGAYELQLVRQFCPHAAEKHVVPLRPHARMPLEACPLEPLDGVWLPVIAAAAAGDDRPPVLLADRIAEDGQPAVLLPEGLEPGASQWPVSRK